MTKVWDNFLSPRDKAVLAAAGYGARAGFGSRPALLIIDVTYGFTGDRPEPILDSIKRWNNSCGEESWTAISAIKTLAASFRAKRLPVIYSKGGTRPDNWDSGSWSWKNNRTGEAKPRPSGEFGYHDIVEAIAPLDTDIVISKLKPSAFLDTPLLSHLTYLGCDSIIATGCTTSGCVRATVLDAFSSNLRSIVVEEACFDRSEASHAVTLFDLQSKYADVLNAEEVLEYVQTLEDDLFPNLPRA